MRRMIGIAWLFGLLALPTLATAQLIPIKSVPIATGGQFMIYPTQNYGMAGLSIARNDTLLDPFSNPARGALFTGTSFYTLPTIYLISEDLGSARTFPLGLMYGSAEWFGAAVFSLQQLKGAGNSNFDPGLGNLSLTNTYFHGLFGKHIPDVNASLAVGLTWANLKGLDGVDLLYANSRKIEQSGDMLNVSVGIYKELVNEQTLDLLMLYNRFRMQHDVTYWNWGWRGVDFINDQASESVVRNNDHSNTIGMQVGYTRPLGGKGWQFGVHAAGNWKSHPKIPNYELQNIPRDPGDSDAYQVGFGLVHQKNRSTFGFDVIYEPIWSNTWADAAEPIESASGRIIQPGQITVNNDFEFSNMIMRFGLQTRGKARDFQLGLQVRSISYSLDQYNYVEERRRDLQESWMEWGLTWGWNFRLSDFTLIYQGSLLSGVGRPGISGGGISPTLDFSADAANFIIAPSGSLTLQEAVVFTHRITFLIPLD